MPTYEYLCENCGHRLEEFQSITAKPLRKCPNCKKLKLKRLISAGAGIIFKGSGFYETDYRSSSYKEGEKKAKESSSSLDKKSESTDKAANKSDSSSTGNKTETNKKEKSAEPKSKSKKSENLIN